MCNAVVTLYPMTTTIALTMICCQKRMADYNQQKLLVTAGKLMIKADINKLNVYTC